MRALLVGAGSVGQVYGWHLQKAGVEVHFYVKEKYADEARSGFVLYPPGSKTPQKFVPNGVVTSAAEAGATTWDQVWLCISSPALGGDWFPALAAATGGATWISLLPGIRDRERVSAVIPKERIVWGLISFSAWHAPLGNEPLPEPGMAWWFPPMSPSLFEGPEAEVTKVVVPLKKGGCAAAKGDVAAMNARGSAILGSVVGAMECGGWTFAGLREPRWAQLGARCIDQALTISCAHAGISKGPAAFAASPTAIRFATRAVRFVTPMDFELFLKAHFSKVGDQTLMGIEELANEGKRRNLPVDALVELKTELEKARAA